MALSSTIEIDALIKFKGDTVLEMAYEIMRVYHATLPKPSSFRQTIGENIRRRLFSLRHAMVGFIRYDAHACLHLARHGMVLRRAMMPFYNDTHILIFAVWRHYVFLLTSSTAIY